MLVVDGRCSSLLGFIGLLLRQPSGLDSLLVRIVLGHFLVEALLILFGEVFELLPLLGGEGSPTFAHDCAQIDELDVWELLHDLGTHNLSEEDVGALGTLGGVRVTILLTASLVLEGFEEITGRIKAGRWHVGCHLGVVPDLVLSRPGFPHVLLLRREGSVHMRRVLGQLPEGHPGIVDFELLPHGVLIQEVSGHVSFGSVLVTIVLLPPPDRDDSITPGIVSWRGDVQ